MRPVPGGTAAPASVLLAALIGSVRTAERRSLEAARRQEAGGRKALASGARTRSGPGARRAMRAVRTGERRRQGERQRREAPSLGSEPGTSPVASARVLGRGGSRLAVRRGEGLRRPPGLSVAIGQRVPVGRERRPGASRPTGRAAAIVPMVGPERRAGPLSEGPDALIVPAGPPGRIVRPGPTVAATPSGRTRPPGAVGGHGCRLRRSRTRRALICSIMTYADRCGDCPRRSRTPSRGTSSRLRCCWTTTP